MPLRVFALRTTTDKGGTMAESFFQRWSRRKAEAEQKLGDTGLPSSSADHPLTDSTNTASPSVRMPTLHDVAQLNAHSDYSLFVAKSTDKIVRRAALKKLFADPHFHTMDRLDIYIDDYTKSTPLSAGMLAALQHTKNLFAPLADDAMQDEEREQQAMRRNDSHLEPSEAQTTSADLPRKTADDDNLPRERSTYPDSP